MSGFVGVLLARELEKMREEARRREERLASHLTHLSRQLEEQRKRDEELMRRMRQFADRLSELESLPAPADSGPTG